MRASRYKVAVAALATLLLTLLLAATANATPSGIVIPAGDVATLSNATFGGVGNCPGNFLAYGYELNAGANVLVGGGVTGANLCNAEPGATIGPFTTSTQLRLYLDDVSCGNTFYSDGNHALVAASNPWTWSVAIMDSDSGCVSGPGVSRVPVAPGTGNFNVTVTLTPVTGDAVCATTRTLVTGSPGYATAGFWPRAYANLLTFGACIAIDRVSASPSPRNAALIAWYDGYVTRLVQGGMLTSPDGAYLEAAAGAL